MFHWNVDLCEVRILCSQKMWQKQWWYVFPQNFTIHQGAIYDKASINWSETGLRKPVNLPEANASFALILTPRTKTKLQEY